MADLRENEFGAVDGAVIGALLDHADAERAFALPGLRVLDARMDTDLLADQRLVPCILVDRADQAGGVAVGLQIDRHAAAQEQGAVMGGLVVVAVEQHQIVLGDQRG